MPPPNYFRIREEIVGVFRFQRVCLLVSAAIVAVSVALRPPAASAASFTVTSTTDAVDVSPGDGRCASAGGQCTLRAAIQEANAAPGPDIVVLPAGVYVLSILGQGENASATGDLDVTQPLTIAGGGAASTTIDGGGIDRVLHVLGGTLQLSGLTLRNGKIPFATENGRGGAIYNAGGAVTLSDVVLTANTSTSGTVFNDEGSALTIQGGVFSANAVSFGGALFNNGTATLSGTTISANTSASGGGLYSRLGVLTVTDSTISGNSASSGTIGGGGLRVLGGGTTIVTRSLLHANTAALNGGAINNSGTLTVANTTLSGNEASGSGGGLYVNGGSVTLNNDTIASNRSGAGAGAVHVAAGSVSARNTLAADNGSNCSGAMASQGYNLDSGTTCGFTTAGDLRGTNPALDPLRSNGGPTQTHALRPGSAAIDAGSPAAPGASEAGCEATDQRGVTRPADGNGDGLARCDIGAFEAPALPASAPAATATPVRTPTGAPSDARSVQALTPTLTPTPGPTLSPTLAPTRPAPQPSPTGGEPGLGGPADSLGQPAPPEAEMWILVLAPIPLYALDGTLIGEAQPGEWYLILRQEDAWLLAVWEFDPEFIVWIEQDAEKTAPSPAQELIQHEEWESL